MVDQSTAGEHKSWPLPGSLEKFLLATKNLKHIPNFNVTSKYQIGLLLQGAYKDVNVFLDKKKKIVAVPEANIEQESLQANGNMKSFLFDTIFTDCDTLLNICKFGLMDSVKCLFSGYTSCFVNLSDLNTGTSYRGEMMHAMLSWIFTLIDEIKKHFSQKYLLKLSAVQISSTNRKRIIDLFGEQADRKNQQMSVIEIDNFSELNVSCLERALFYMDTAIALTQGLEPNKDPILFGINLYSTDFTGKETKETLYFFDLCCFNDASIPSTDPSTEVMTIENIFKILQAIISKKPLFTKDNQSVATILRQITAIKSLKMFNVLYQMSVHNPHENLLALLRNGNRLYRCMHKRNLQKSRKINEIAYQQEVQSPKFKHHVPFKSRNKELNNCTSDSEISCNTMTYLERKANLGSRSNHLKRKQYPKLIDFPIKEKQELWVDGPKAMSSVPMSTRQSKHSTSAERSNRKSQKLGSNEAEIYGCCESLADEDLNQDFFIGSLPKPLKPVQLNSFEGDLLIASLVGSTKITQSQTSLRKPYEKLMNLDLEKIKPDVLFADKTSSITNPNNPKQHFNKVAEWIQKTSNPISEIKDQPQSLTPKRYNEIQELFPYLPKVEKSVNESNLIPSEPPQTPQKKRALKFFRNDLFLKDQKPIRSISVDKNIRENQEPSIIQPLIQSKNFFNDFLSTQIFMKKGEKEPSGQGKTLNDPNVIINTPLEIYNKKRESIHSSSGHGSEGSSSGYQHLYNFSIASNNNFSQISSSSTKRTFSTSGGGQNGHTSSGYESIVRDSTPASSHCDSISEKSADHVIGRLRSKSRSRDADRINDKLIESQTSSSSSTTSRRSNSVPSSKKESPYNIKPLPSDTKSLDDLLETLRDLNTLENDFPVQTNDQILEKIRFQKIYDCLEVQDQIKREIVTLKEALGFDAESWRFKPSVIDRKSATDHNFLEDLQEETDTLKEYLERIKKLMNEQKPLQHQ